MTQPQARLVPAQDLVADPLWIRVRKEAAEAAKHEPELAVLMHTCVLQQDSLEAAIAHRVAQRLDAPVVPADLIRHAYADALADEHMAIREALWADLNAILQRDPATGRALDAVLYLKGFHALATHRLAHWLWRNGRRELARYLHSRSSEVFQTDIHPAVQIGRGVFLDHATGIVIGETAVIDDDVSILQAVTLGGTGKEVGDRHPKIRRGVLIGAGAIILGNIEVGPCARVGAGSVVLKDVPAETTVAGVPAKIVGQSGCKEPSRLMDQVFYDIGL